MNSDPYVDDEMEPDPRLNRITNAIIGAAIEVHRTLGPGYLEAVYQQAMAVEMALRSIPFVGQAPVELVYKGHPVGEGRMDFLVAGCVVVELKTVDDFAPVHAAQVISYLKATRHRLGLLINFNVRPLKDGIRRIAH